MNEQIRIEFVGRRQTTINLVAQDKFHVRPVGWLQNLLWKVLVRLGATQPVVESHTKVTTYTLDARDVMEEVYKQYVYVRDQERLRPLRIIMGRDKLTQLARVPYSEQITYGVLLFEEPSKVMGLEITVVPWMNGLVVLP